MRCNLLVALHYTKRISTAIRAKKKTVFKDGLFKNAMRFRFKGRKAV
jgi:hypothetical protein